MHLILRIFLVAALTFSLSVTAAPTKQSQKEEEISVLNPHTSVIGHHEHDEFCIVTDGEAHQIKVAEQKKVEELHQETLRLQAERKAQTRRQIQATEIAIQSAQELGTYEIRQLKMGKQRGIPGAPTIKSSVTNTQIEEPKLKISQKAPSKVMQDGAEFSAKKPKANVATNKANRVKISKKQSAKETIAKQQNNGSKVAVKKSTTKKFITKRQSFGAKVAAKKPMAKKMIARKNFFGAKVAAKKPSSKQLMAKRKRNGLNVAIKKQYAKTTKKHRYTATTKVARKRTQHKTTLAYQSKIKPQNQFNKLKTIRYSTYEAATKDKKTIYV